MNYHEYVIIVIIIIIVSRRHAGLCSLMHIHVHDAYLHVTPEMDLTERLVVFRMGRSNASRIFEQFPCVRHIMSTKPAIPYGECIIHEISMKGMFSAFVLRHSVKPQDTYMYLLRERVEKRC
jgi:hypothetical protein